MLREVIEEIALIYPSPNKISKEHIKPIKETTEEQVVEDTEEKPRKRGKLVLRGNTLYYIGPGTGEDKYVFRIGDVEIHIDKHYEISKVILWNMDKYMDQEDIEELKQVALTSN